MASPALDFAFDPQGITLSRPTRGGLLGRLGIGRDRRELDRLPLAERTLLLAIADLRAAAAERPAETLEITPEHIRLSHRLAAALDAETAASLGLPPVVDLSLRTDAEGVLGSPSFRLRHEWVKNGQRQTVQRVGAILKTSAGSRRLPEWLMDAVAVSEDFEPGRNESQHWNALARFRQSLDPGVRVAEPTAAARVSMTDFLAGLEVRIADRFALSPTAEDDFDLVPFSGRELAGAGYDETAIGVPEEAGELAGPLLRGFQDRVRSRGALSAYRLGPGNFLVIDPAAAPALSVMARMQHAPAAERKAFLRNPRPLVTQAVEAALRGAGRLDGLDAVGEEEAIEAAALPLFVETQEYADRVTGVGVFRKPELEIGPGSGTTWLPEAFVERLQSALAALTPAELDDLHRRVSEAMAAGEASVPLAGFDLPARAEALALIGQYRGGRGSQGYRRRGQEAVRADRPRDGRQFRRIEVGRAVEAALRAGNEDVPSLICTDLKAHQLASFAWQVAAWKAGLPGILNADEQGLGKTLQTIAFLAWLKQQAADPRAPQRGPVLVVAPTSLLQNWEQEVARHTHEPGLGHLIRLYGSGIGARKRAGTSGRDIDAGESKLDLALLHEALAEGRAHRFWILTTYTTLVNYQHSLREIPSAPSSSTRSRR